ncbi:MAG: sulfur carrier protein ThiS [SAR324 cluster bacterium]|nr:sulfur carrier protein ThiS [SAR324 cluster bacterium]
MKLFINDKKEETQAETLDQLMVDLGLASTKAIALALNDEVVPKKDWAEVQLKQSDRILIIRPTQGG